MIAEVKMIKLDGELNNAPRCVFVYRRNGAIVSIFGKPMPGTETATVDMPEVIAAMEALGDPDPIGGSVGLPYVPQTANSGDFIRALDELGWLNEVDQAVAQADVLTQRLWARSSVFNRQSPFISTIAAAMNKSDEDMDNLFIKANSY
jgi:hypothetical protein